jgi:predicted DNA-binding WGR domain protein
MITIEHKFRAHIGGSKFYETVLFERDDGGPSVLVKRFGKISLVRQGGQTKIEDYPSAAAARAEMTRIWKEKGKPREYSSTAPSSSHIEKQLAETGGLPSLTLAGRKVVMSMAAEHYGKGSGMDYTIADFLKMDDKYDPNADLGEIIETGPEIEVDRGETWGSW